MGARPPDAGVSDEPDPVSPKLPGSRRQKMPTSVWGVAALWSTVLGGVAIWRVWVLEAGALDLGFMVHALGAVARGGIFEPASWAGWTFLQDHFSPLALPLAWLADSPLGAYFLVAAQALAVAASIPLAWLLISSRVKEVWARRTLLAAYALSPPLLFAVLYDFHPSLLATPFLVALLLGLTNGDRRLVWIGGIGAMLAREDLALLTIGILVLCGHTAPRARTGLVIGALACLLGWRVTTGGPEYATQLFFSYVEVGQPMATLRKALGAAWSDGFLPRLLLVLAIPWLWWRPLAWRPLLAGAVLGVPLLLADSPNTKLLGFHYWAFVPPLALAAVVMAWVGSSRRLAGGAVLLLALLAGGPLVGSLLSPSADSVLSLATATAATRSTVSEVHSAVRCLSDNGLVAVDSRVSPLLGHRSEIAVLPHPFEPLVVRVGPREVVLRAADPRRPEQVISSDEGPAGYERSTCSPALWVPA